MPDDHPPDDVRRLLAERRDARAERDWGRADALRERIASLGWQVEDTPGGSTARPLLPTGPAETGYARPDDLASRLEDAAAVPVSVQLVAEDHAEDVSRFLDGLLEHRPAQPMEVVIVANAPSFDLGQLLGRSWPEAVVLGTSARLGWADARTLALRRSLGEVTILADTSVEPIGDFLTPILAAFEDPSVGLVGPWGVTSETGRQFEEAPPGEVDAIEGYLMAVRRAALRAVGGFDPRFRFYRNADLDFSFAVRDAGWRAVRTKPAGLRRHEHRGWNALPAAERDRLSKRNFYRFLGRWGHRPDLLRVRSAG